jgi:uncharacterized damage-inducible protein DinB
MTPQEAKIIGDYLVNDLEREIPTTIRVIEAVPNDNLDYKPDAKSTTGLGLVQHLAVSDTWFLNSIADGVFAPPKESSESCGISTPAEGAARYKEGMSAALGRLRALPDHKLAEEIDFYGFMKAPAVAYIGMATKHSIHHRGQLSAYLRAMGGKVPGIYGPSGDSQ